MSGFDRDDDLPDWDLDLDLERTPDGVIPVPAQEVADLRGRRVIVGLPGLGWRGDLRADAPIIQGSRTFVPVLLEHEWYRAEAEQTEVFAPLVPLERVWVEVVGTVDVDAKAPAGDLVARLVSLDAPPRRAPTPARTATALTGRRVVKVADPDAKAAPDQRDLRAVTEPHTTVDGDICVRVCTELDWYRWAWSGKPPKTLTVPVHLLWLE